MTTKLTTDWHLGCKRSGGTTPQSQLNLKQYLRSALTAQLDDHDHILAGDIFDSFTVETSEFVAAYSIFAMWLETYGKQLVLLRGNHDWSPKANQVSSFDLLGHILRDRFPDQVVVADKVTEWKQFVLVPHLANNDLLDIEVEKLKKVKGKVLVFHANVDNKFSTDSQHSLNLSREQIDMLTKKCLVVAGHEHAYRTLNDGRCLVLGNGAPSSIADCLGPDKKYAALVEGTDYELVPIWSRDEEFAEMPWHDLVETKAKFVRVVGDASAAQAADVVNAIAKYRQKSQALVISNATTIEGAEAFEELEAKSIESIRAFDVMAAIMAELDEKQRVVVKELLSD